ncbi:hypothetical protein SASPL_117912 [Salvia splendens]|uniref:Protein kinase domain-containing protein n=1 Tax=Salvia splendens TaxID=180675 RepID=A0A8X8ZYM9_SALSN|nr:hypothetical protein SASPL_117912 [Salvia splendens]
MAEAEALLEASGSRFSDLELIGRGSFGDVYKGYDKELKRDVAIKAIDLEESQVCGRKERAAPPSSSGRVASDVASPMARFRSETWNTGWIRVDAGSCRR